MIFDTHAHYYDEAFDADRDALLASLPGRGVALVVCPGCDPESSRQSIALAERYGFLYAAAGYHPENLEGAALSDLDAVKALCAHPKVVAVGEIGLDLFGDDPQFERQQWLLDEQLKLAKRYDLPVILHSRRTHDKLAMHLKRHDLSRTGVVHGFSGSLQQAERFVQLGYKIGVGGTITYPRASKTRDGLCILMGFTRPLMSVASLLLETDAPDMPLNGFQGQANRPEQAARVFAVLCELRSEPADEIAEVLLNNTYAVFSVSG